MIDPWTLFYVICVWLVIQIPIGMIVGYWISKDARVIPNDRGGRLSP